MRRASVLVGWVLLTAGLMFAAFAPETYRAKTV